MQSIGDGGSLENELFFRSNGVSFERSARVPQHNSAAPRVLWRVARSFYVAVHSFSLLRLAEYNGAAVVSAL